MEQGQRTDEQVLAVLERRIMRLEERLAVFEAPAVVPAAFHPAWPLAFGGAAVIFGYLGMGVPKHPYQYLFAGLLLLLGYHRRFFLRAAAAWHRPLAVVNYLNLLLFFVLILGGGIRHPFSWVTAPGIVKTLPPGEEPWYGKLVPDYSLHWQTVPGVSDWSIDLTKVQVFLLIATLAGTLFRFPGFASITALALLVVSVPVYLSFAWDWVVAFLTIAGISFYLQTAPPAGRRDPARR